MKGLAAALAMLLAACFLAAPAAAQPLRPRTPGTPQPAADGANLFAVMRQDEDWSFVEPASPDRLKWLPLGDDVHLTVALDARFQLESFDNEQFGTFPGRDGTFHLRFNPHVALDLGRRARLYLALDTGRVGGRAAPPGPADEDGPDLHQAFAELALGDLAGLARPDLLLRLGRQELHFGAGRMISVRVSPNLPLDFTGVFLRGRMGRVVGEAFAARQSEERTGSFNNRIDDGRAVWGLYSSARLGASRHLDLYYIGLDRDVSPYAFSPVPLAEVRHSLGARLWTGRAEPHAPRLDLEMAVQFGRFERDGGDGGRIFAWTVGLDASYGLARAPLAPLLNLQIGVNSGDGDPGDHVLRTFRAPNPPGRYFGEGNPLGPGNQAGFRIMADLRIAPGVTITPELGAQWRLSRRDGVYSAAQAPVRGAAGHARRILSIAALSGEAVLDPRLSLVARLARYQAGSYLRDNPPAEDILYFELGSLVRF